MGTPEEHTALLRTFDVDHLLTLLTIEAKRSHEGHFTIFAFTTGYKVAFDTPDINPPGCRQQGYAQLAEMSHAPTLKEALIAALVCGKTFADYFDGDAQAWWQASIDRDPHVRAFFAVCHANATPQQDGAAPREEGEPR
jgi:hypothetical protein